MSHRITGKKALKTVLKIDKNAYAIERIINKLYKEEEEYLHIIHQVIGDIMDKKSLKSISESLKTDKSGWNHEAYRVMADKLKEQDNFIENPYEVEEGVQECHKCGSKKVFSITIALRSSDEGDSILSQCINCNSKWRSN